MLWLHQEVKQRLPLPSLALAGRQQAEQPARGHLGIPTLPTQGEDSSPTAGREGKFVLTGPINHPFLQLLLYQRPRDEHASPVQRWGQMEAWLHPRLVGSKAVFQDPPERFVLAL